MSESTWAIIAGGGAAGHLLPGLAVAQALVERGHDPSTIHFVGSDRGVEATLVPNAGFTLDELPGAASNDGSRSPTSVPSSD